MLRSRIKELDFIDLILPVSKDLVIVEAPHGGQSTNYGREYFTSYIAWELSERFGWGTIISRTSRDVVDFNRSKDYRKSPQEEGILERNRAISEILSSLNWNEREPLIYISIHGLSERKARELDIDFIVGTRRGELCPQSLRNEFLNRLSTALRVTGAPSKGEAEVPGYIGPLSLVEFKMNFPPNLFVIQLELSETLRREYTDELISSLFLAVKGLMKG